MALSIFIDVPVSLIPATHYTIDNIFFPVLEDINIVDDFNIFRQCEKKILYCHNNSRYLTENFGLQNALIILLDDWAIAYFSRLRSYDVNRIIWINKIPCLFPSNNFTGTSSKSSTFPFDLFSASFFFLSCYQELVIQQRDAKGRVPLRETLQHQLGCIRTPIVNEYLTIFLEAASALWKCAFKFKPMPNGESAFCAISHDVDHIDCTTGQYFGHLIHERRRLNWGTASTAAIVRNAMGRKYIFSMMAKKENHFNVHSTHFFLSDYPSAAHRDFANTLASEYRDSLCEIGHHISDRSIFENSLPQDRDRFSANFGNSRGARVHTLRFETFELFRQLENQGYRYDSSLMFAEDIGYRTGFTYPHYLFDFANRRAFDVIEIPLNIMDTTLVDQKYLNLPDDQAEKTIFQALKTAISYGGGLTLLIHNSFFYVRTPERLKMYERLLLFLSQQNVGIGTCEQLYSWRVGK